MKRHISPHLKELLFNAWASAYSSWTTSFVGYWPSAKPFFNNPNHKEAFTNLLVFLYEKYKLLTTPRLSKTKDCYFSHIVGQGSHHIIMIYDSVCILIGNNDIRVWQYDLLPNKKVADFDDFNNLDPFPYHNSYPSAILEIGTNPRIVYSTTF